MTKIAEPDVLKEVKQKLELGSVKFEVCVLWSFEFIFILTFLLKKLKVILKQAR